MAMKKILVVDDDEAIVQILQILLEHEGYEVATASSGREGLSRALEYEPDLLLLDIMMPEMDGWQVLEELRRHSGWQARPIILLTARVEEEDRARGLDQGADDYITKPFSNRELLARVRKELRRGPTAAALQFTSGALHINFQTHEAQGKGKPMHLTPAEWRIMSALLAQPGRVVTADELLRASREAGRRTTVQGLKVQIHHLRKKLQPLCAGTPWIVNERNNGYRFRLDDEHSLLAGVGHPVPNV